MKVSQRLHVLSGVVLILFVISAAVSLWGMHQAEHRFRHFIEKNQALLFSFNEMYAQGLQQGQAIRNILLDPANKQGYENLNKASSAFDEGHSAAQQLASDVPELAKELETITSLRRGQKELQAQIVQAVKDGQTSVAREVLVDKETPAWRKLRAILTEEVKKLRADAVVAQQDMEQQLGLIRTALVVTLCAAIAISLFLSTRTARKILEQLGGEPDYAAGITQTIAQGNLSSRIELQAGDQSSLLFAMNTMQNQLRQIISDIQSVVTRAAAGDFTSQIDLHGKQGFGREISESLNQLNHNLMRQIGGNPATAVEVASSIAAGDLSIKVPVQPGDQHSVLAAMAVMRNNLNDVIEEVRTVVDAASQGNFSYTLSDAGKQGYARTLTQLLNSLSQNANAALLDIARVASAVGQGDLTQGISQRYPGVFGTTAEGLNQTVQSLRELLGNVVLAIDTIQGAAQEISAGNRDLSARTEEQASSLEETAASLEEFTSMMQNNNSNAREANQLAEVASDVAVRGGDVVKASVQTMAEIATSSHKISDIISVIDGIAFQTNILALNAAVEAARAGEQGRGFAVVASEVRNLALRAAGAAKEIKDLITESVDKVERGTEQAEEAGRTMEEIVSSISRVTGIIRDISEASLEQATGIQQINNAVAAMDQATQQNAALVEEVAATAESLEDQARELQREVSSFKLNQQTKVRTLAGY